LSYIAVKVITMAISRVIIVMFHPISADGDLEAPEVFGGEMACES
jgi:hypothetical protein